MTVQQWAEGRHSAGLTQVQAADALGISQPYLSQLEKGSRKDGLVLARKAAALYRLPPTALPLPNAPESSAVKPDRLQSQLAALGYPGFAHVSPGKKCNPAGLDFAALIQRDLGTRLVEAMPWVFGTFPDCDCHWLRVHATLRHVQQRSG